MRWVWWRRDDLTPGRRVPDDHDQVNSERAQHALAKARADEPRVADIAGRIQQKLDENRWSPKIAAAFREGPRQ